MEVFNEQVIDYLKENNTTIDNLLKEYNDADEIETKPSADYIQSFHEMSKKEKHQQMNFEQNFGKL